MNRIQYIVVAFMAFLCFLGTTASAGEYYQYRDADGFLHVTDKLNEVPEKHRTSDNRFDKINSKAKNHNNQQSSAMAEKQNGSDDAFNKMKTNDQLKALNDEKDALEKTYSQLMERVQYLEKEKQKVKTAEASARYEHQVSELNKKISDYENRRAAFDQKLKLYKKNKKGSN